MGDLLQKIPSELPKELIEEIACSESVRIERIVSRGHHSPPDFWYDQVEHEWVVVVSGEGRLRFELDDQTLHLKPGQHVYIPPHCRHRVEWTSPDEATVWLAVFYR